MTTKHESGMTILEAENGKYLTNGETYTTRVFLGKNADPGDWHEVDSIEDDPELTAEEALAIIMGGGGHET